MSPTESLLHLLSFLAPAIVVGLLVALAARLLLPAAARPQSWWLGAGLNVLVGSAVLAAGLWFFGNDGKMATYAALVLAIATVQWLGGRAWRG